MSAHGEHIKPASSSLAASRLLSIARRLVPWLLPILLVFLWYLGGVYGWFSKSLLPTLPVVVETTVKMVLDGSLLKHFLVSGGRALFGFSIGTAVGLAFGLVNGISRLSEELTDTTFQMIRNVPILALFPIILIWFGIGETSKIVMIALAVFFPVYINTYSGVKSVDPGLIEMGRVYGLTKRELYAKIILPGALQSILVGIRFSLGITWLVLILCETVATSTGIGYMATNARAIMRMDVVVLSILLYAILGKLSDTVARLLERGLLRWNPVFQKKTSW
ncbi:MAG: ABC transporter permease subunit [Coriobacteriales bacterium]|jgi:sulfonate transport system permease protein|nr:ABC transporter permease subunit [Coriobacteriales bacterium]